jgi:hypothetical protein
LYMFLNVFVKYYNIYLGMKGEISNNQDKNTKKLAFCLIVS